MPKASKLWELAVPLLCFGGYIPIIIGGYKNPADINRASYSLWLILAMMLTYSAKAQNFACWRMFLGFVIGNCILLGEGLILKGSTFNLGGGESITLYGLISVIGTWIVIGSITKKWNARILFLGGVVTDILSFYPQVKQYWGPAEVPTGWIFIGWAMWIAGVFINILFVEQLREKLALSKERYRELFKKEKSRLLIIEQSAFSIENVIFMVVTVIVMAV